MLPPSPRGGVLPNGATRSPDAAWVRCERLADLTPDQKQRFLPLRPDFVVESRSPSDSLATVQAKMREYVENGAHLGWLIDRQARGVYVHEPGRRVWFLENPDEVSGEPVLPGFVLDSRPI